MSNDRARFDFKSKRRARATHTAARPAHSWRADRVASFAKLKRVRLLGESETCRVEGEGLVAAGCLLLESGAGDLAGVGLADPGVGAAAFARDLRARGAAAGFRLAARVGGGGGTTRVGTSSSSPS